MTDVAFRPAVAADTGAIVALMRAYYDDDGYRFDDGAAAGALLGLMTDARLGRLWVASDSGEIVGYLAVTLGCSLEYTGRDAFVDELVIAPGHRGLGLGRAALAIADAYCREAGVRALHLEVEPQHDAAIGLYQRAGFVDRHRRLMTKTLADAAPDDAGSGTGADVNDRRAG